MTEIEWKTFKHFKSTENWGDPSKIEYELVDRLERLRYRLRQSIIVTCGTQGKHTINSYHYRGEAVDIIVPSMRGFLFDLFIEAVRCNFTGIGIYPRWKYNNFTIGGLHLDIRNKEERALWICVEDDAENRQYLPLTRLTLDEVFYIDDKNRRKELI